MVGDIIFSDSIHVQLQAAACEEQSAGTSLFVMIHRSPDALSGYTVYAPPNKRLRPKADYFRLIYMFSGFF